MTLKGVYDGNNIFAKILRGEAPCIKVFEDEEVLIFMDIFPQSQGHCLVIPKDTDARNLLELAPDRLGPLMQRVQRLSQAVVTALHPDGVQILQFNGATAGQTVYHPHVHVIPRYDNLPLQPHHQGKPADEDILKDQARRIAEAM